MSGPNEVRVIRSSSGEFVIMAKGDVRVSKIDHNPDGSVRIFGGSHSLTLGQDIPEGAIVKFASDSQPLIELPWEPNKAD